MVVASPEARPPQISDPLGRCGVNRHQPPESINLLRFPANNPETGRGQSMFQFAAAEGMAMCVTGPGQYAV